MIRAVLFDLDDTLYPESAWRSSGFDAVAAFVSERSNVNAVAIRSELERLDGGPDRSQVLDQLVGLLDDPGFAANDLVDVFRHHVPRHLDMFPEARAYLEHCVLPTGIITDGHWRSQVRKIESLDVRDLVGPVIVTDLLAADRAAWKPSTTPFVTASSALGLPPHDVLYVGDNPAKDFLGPNQLGMSSIQLRHPDQVHDSTPGSPEHAATWTVESWKDLVSVLDRERAI